MRNPWDNPTDVMIETAKKISEDLKLPLDNVIAVLKNHMNHTIDIIKKIKD